MSSVRKITLNRYNELTKDNPVAPLYVVNVGKPRGMVAFNLTDDVGSPVAVVVPATFIPIDLTEQVTRESLLRSTQFRRLLSRDFLAIVREDSAEEYLQSSLAKTEIKRLRKLNIASIGESSADEQEEEEIELDGRQSAKQIFESDANSKEDAFVIMFLADCDNPEVSDEDLESQFLSTGLDLPQEHLQRLAESVTRSNVRDLILQAMERD